MNNEDRNLFRNRKRVKKNQYPSHTNYRHIHSVLRDYEGNMCFSEELDNVIYIRKTNIKDLPFVKPNKKGQRPFKRSYIESHLRKYLLDDNYKDSLFMYCIHEISQQLRPISDFTTNKITPHLRPSQFIYGLQPFCKESKKKYVNNGPAGNSSRTKDQHLEDLGGRFRQRLIISILGNVPKISYKDIYKKYNGRCFKCKVEIPFERSDLKGLDHTLPHSYWYPYTTENATLLCTDCNQSKKDKWPSEFYNDVELKELSKLTNIDYSILSSKTPLFNEELIKSINDKFDFVMESCQERFRNRKSPIDFLKKIHKESSRLFKSENQEVKSFGEKMKIYSERELNEYGL
jgi:hypothetical protein